MATQNLGRVGLVLKGEWDSATSYTALDVVSHDGNAWAAKQNSTNVEPTTGNSDFWQLFSNNADLVATVQGYKEDAASSAAAAAASAQYGEDAFNAIAHTFDPGVDYTAGKYVWYNGELYRFNVDHPAGAWIGTDAARYTATDEFSLIQQALDTKADAAEVADLKSALNGMSTATAEDVGKALKAKTVSGGKVTEWEFGETGVAVDPTLSVEGKAADAKATGDAINDLDGEVFYQQSGISEQVALKEHSTTKAIGDQGIVDRNSNVYAFLLQNATKITLWAQPSSARSAFYAFFDGVESIAECDNATNLIEVRSGYPDRQTIEVEVPSKNCLLCINSVPREPQIYIVEKNLSNIDRIDDEIAELNGGFDGIDQRLDNIETGLIEALPEQQVLPSGVSIMSWTPRDAKALTDSDLCITNGQKAAYSGTATKFEFKTSPFQHGFACRAVLFQFRLNGDTYEEIYREVFVPDGDNHGSFAINIPVEAGDVFGIGGSVGVAQRIDYGKTLKTTFTDAVVTFTASELAGASEYIEAIYDVTITPSTEIAKKEQISATGLPISLLRELDIGYGCGKNLIDTSKVVMAYITENGVARSTSYLLALAKVKPNTIYALSRGDNLIGFYGNAVDGFFDADGNFLFAINEKDMQLTQEMERCFTTPSNCYYVAIQLKGRVGLSVGAYNFDTTATTQLEIGNHNTPYEPYKKTVTAVKNVPIVQHLPTASDYVYDAPINLVVLGDSISSDARDSQLQSLGHWFYPMREKYSFISSFNLGVGGATWTHTSNTAQTLDYDSKSDSNVVANQIDRLFSNITNGLQPVPDVVFIHCGINDRGRALDGDTGTNYGDPDTVFDGSVSYENLPYGDTKLQNMCGAIRFCIEKIWRTYPYVKIVLTTPLRTSGGAPNSNVKIKALNETIKACAAYLAVPVLDLGYESHVYSPLASNYLSDGLHPDIDHGGKMLADMIGHYLISKFGGKPFFNLHSIT